MSFPCSPKRKIEIVGEVILVDDEPLYSLVKDYYGEDYEGPRWSVWHKGNIIAQDDMRCNLVEILEYQNNIDYIQWIKTCADMVNRNDKIALIKQFREHSTHWANAEFVWRLSVSLNSPIGGGDNSVITIQKDDGTTEGRYAQYIGLAEAKHLYEAFEDHLKQYKETA